MGIIRTPKTSKTTFQDNFIKMSIEFFHLNIISMTLYKDIRPLQFNYLSYELFLEKKSCQTPKKKKKKDTFGVLRTKVVLKFSVRLQKKKKKCKF